MQPDLAHRRRTRDNRSPKNRLRSFVVEFPLDDGAGEVAGDMGWSGEEVVIPVDGGVDFSRAPSDLIHLWGSMRPSAITAYDGNSEARAGRSMPNSSFTLKHNIGPSSDIDGSAVETHGSRTERRSSRQLARRMEYCCRTSMLAAAVATSDRHRSLPRSGLDRTESAPATNDCDRKPLCQSVRSLRTCRRDLRRKNYIVHLQPGSRPPFGIVVNVRRQNSSGDIRFPAPARQMPRDECSSCDKQASARAALRAVSDAGLGSRSHRTRSANEERHRK